MTSLAFTKMHGLGNDYVYLDGFRQRLGGIDAPALSRAVSDRHRGIGSDGLILVLPPTGEVAADVRMEMYNADGSRGEMCGNGIRCVAKYALERGLGGTLKAETAEIRVQTDRGVLALTASVRDGKVDRVRVDMGPPILLPGEIPVAVELDDGTGKCVAQPFQIAGWKASITCVSMGNPHAVTFVENVHLVDLEMFGPVVEYHAAFPRRVNFHVASVQSPREATLRTWERGSGITQACGTGACAVLVAGVLEGRLDRSALLHLPGGDLHIEWAGSEKEPGSVFKTGPAVEVFSGTWVDAGQSVG